MGFFDSSDDLEGLVPVDIAGFGGKGVALVRIDFLQPAVERMTSGGPVTWRLWRHKYPVAKGRTVPTGAATGWPHDVGLVECTPEDPENRPHFAAKEVRLEVKVDGDELKGPLVVDVGAVLQKSIAAGGETVTEFAEPSNRELSATVKVTAATSHATKLQLVCDASVAVLGAPVLQAKDRFPTAVPLLLDGVKLVTKQLAIALKAGVAAPAGLDVALGNARRMGLAMRRRELLGGPAVRDVVVHLYQFADYLSSCARKLDKKLKVTMPKWEKFSERLPKAMSEAEDSKLAVVQAAIGAALSGDGGSHSDREDDDNGGSDADDAGTVVSGAAGVLPEVEAWVPEGPSRELFSQWWNAIELLGEALGSVAKTAFPYVKVFVKGLRRLYRAFVAMQELKELSAAVGGRTTTLLRVLNQDGVKAIIAEDDSTRQLLFAVYVAIEETVQAIATYRNYCTIRQLASAETMKEKVEGQAARLKDLMAELHQLVSFRAMAHTRKQLDGVEAALARIEKRQRTVVKPAPAAPTPAPAPAQPSMSPEDVARLEERLRTARATQDTLQTEAEAVARSLGHSNVALNAVTTALAEAELTVARTVGQLHLAADDAAAVAEAVGMGTAQVTELTKQLGVTGEQLGEVVAKSGLALDNAAEVLRRTDAGAKAAAALAIGLEASQEEVAGLAASLKFGNEEVGDLIAGLGTAGDKAASLLERIQAADVTLARCIANAEEDVEALQRSVARVQDRTAKTLATLDATDEVLAELVGRLGLGNDAVGVLLASLGRADERAASLLKALDTGDRQLGALLKKLDIGDAAASALLATLGRSKTEAQEVLMLTGRTAEAASRAAAEVERLGRGIQTAATNVERLNVQVLELLSKVEAAPSPVAPGSPHGQLDTAEVRVLLGRRYRAEFPHLSVTRTAAFDFEDTFHLSSVDVTHAQVPALPALPDTAEGDSDRESPLTPLGLTAEPTMAAGQMQSRRLTPAEALGRFAGDARLVFVEGRGGFGKTTLGRHIARRQDAELPPVLFVPLTRVLRAVRQQLSGTLDTLVTAALPLADATAELRQAVAGLPSALWVLDGFDEVVNAGSQPMDRFLRLVLGGGVLPEGHRVVVTTRMEKGARALLPADGDFVRLELRPWGTADVLTFVRQYFTAARRLDEFRELPFLRPRLRSGGEQLTATEHREALGQAATPEDLGTTCDAGERVRAALRHPALGMWQGVPLIADILCLKVLTDMTEQGAALPNTPDCILEFLVDGLLGHAFKALLDEADAATQDAVAAEGAAAARTRVVEEARRRARGFAAGAAKGRSVEFQLVDEPTDPVGPVRVLRRGLCDTEQRGDGATFSKFRHLSVGEYFMAQAFVEQLQRLPQSSLEQFVFKAGALEPLTSLAEVGGSKHKMTLSLVTHIVARMVNSPDPAAARAHQHLGFWLKEFTWRSFDRGLLREEAAIAAKLPPDGILGADPATRADLRMLLGVDTLLEVAVALDDPAMIRPPPSGGPPCWPVLMLEAASEIGMGGCDAGRCSGMGGSLRGLTVLRHLEAQCRRCGLWTRSLRRDCLVRARAAGAVVDNEPLVKYLAESCDADGIVPTLESAVRSGSVAVVHDVKDAARPQDLERTLRFIALSRGVEDGVVEELTGNIAVVDATPFALPQTPLVDGELSRAAQKVLRASTGHVLRRLAHRTTMERLEKLVWPHLEAANITVLRVEHCVGITDNCLGSMLDRLPAVTELRVLNCPRVHCRMLARAADMKVPLRTVDLEGNVELDTAALILADDAPLGRLPHLSALKLRRTNLCSASLSKLLRMLGGQLTTLDLGGCTSLAPDDLALVAQARRLATLGLSGTRVTAPGLEHVVRHLPQLTALDITGCDRLDRAKMARVARHAPKLLELLADGCPAGVPLTEALRSEKLTFEVAPAQRSGLDSVVAAARSGTMVALDLRYVMSPLSAALLVDAVAASPALQRLGLSHSGTLSAGNLRDVAAVCSPALQVLQLPHCPGVDDSVLAAFAEQCRNLTTVSVAGCDGPSDIGLAAFFDKQSFLLAVDAADTYLGDTAMAALLLNNGGLADLSIAGCVKLTPVSFRCLAANSAALQRLDLSRCGAMQQRLAMAYLPLLAQRTAGMLTSLALHRCPLLDARAARAIAMHCAALRELRVGHQRLSEADWVLLFGEARALEVLAMTAVPDVTAPVLEALTTGPVALRELRLKDTIVPATPLAGLLERHARHLHTLDIRGTGACVAAATAAAGCQLRELRVSSVGGAMLRTIVEGRPLAHLTVAGAAFTGEVAAALPASLRELQLQRCLEIDLDALGGLARLPALQKLTAKQCPSVRGELSALSKRMPHTVVSYAK